MAEHRHMVVGFQGSGKTTFAAALWHLIDVRETPTRLSTGLHNGDYEYLEKIASAWEAGWQAARTPHGTWQPITINLRCEEADEEVALSFVDMSGETFEAIFTSRQYDARIEATARGCGGLLLFVTADRIIDDVTIAEVGMSLPEEMPDERDDDEVYEPDGDRQAQTASEGKASAQAAEEAEELSGALKQERFTAARTPRQVQMTDLLDAFCDGPLNFSPKRIAVVVSAWDRARKGMTPDRWLSESLPLLDQYLKTHADVFETRIYGVSAQGGRLPKQQEPDEPSDRDALLAQPVASRRIRVVGHDAGPHDLTHPIAWLSGL